MKTMLKARLLERRIELFDQAIALLTEENKRLKAEGFVLVSSSS